MPMCAEVFPETPGAFALPYLPDVRAAYDPNRPLIAEIGASVLLRLQRLGRHKTARAFAAAWRAAPDLQAALDLAERLQVLPEPAAALGGRCQSLRQTFLAADGAIWRLDTGEKEKLDESQWMLLLAGDARCAAQAFERVPETERTERLCRLVLGLDGGTLRHVPKAYRNLELCDLAIRNGPAVVLHYVPVKLLRRHPQLWQMALRRSADAYRYLPAEQKTKQRLLELVPKAPSLIELLQEPDEKLAAARAALPGYGAALALIPRAERRREDCLAALASGAYGVAEAVPWSYWDAELVELAVLSNPANLKHIPERLLSPELLAKAVELPSFSLTHVPSARRSKTLCRLAVDKKGQRVAEVPPRHVDVAMAVTAVQRGAGWHDLPDAVRAEPEVTAALQAHATWAWHLFTHGERPWQDVLQRCPQALIASHRHVPESLRTAAAYDAAVRTHLMRGDFGHLPKSLRSAARCADALQNGAAWHEVPALLRYFDKRP